MKIEKRNTNSTKKYNIVDRAKLTYLQLPQILIYGEKYKNKLIASDREVYAMLMNRLNLSIQNNWIDSEGNIYFAYSNDELSNDLNISKPTVINIKKRLTQAKLLIEDKTGRWNRLYLLEPVVEPHEAKYIIEKSTQEIKDRTKFTDKEKKKMSDKKKGNKNAEKSTEVKKVNITLGNAEYQDLFSFEKQQILNNLTAEVKKVNPIKKELKEIKELKDSKDQQFDENTLLQNSIYSATKEPEIENQIIDSYVELENLEKTYGEQIINAMKNFSMGSFETFKIYSDKLIFGLRSAEKELGYSISFIDDNYMYWMLFRTFNLVLIKEKNGELKSFTDYLFSSFKRCFIEYGSSNPPVNVNE